MIVMAIFLSVLAAGAAFWLARADLTAKPWLEQGVIGDLTEPDERKTRAARVGLWLFLAVVGSLFALLTSSYLIRMASPDWQAPPAPKVLWINTGALLISSIALQAAVVTARRGESRRSRVYLLAGAAAALAFLFGQILAWRQLAGAGYFLATNPANSFFYLATGLHGAHLIGGLCALAAVIWRAQGDLLGKASQARLELCAYYWHFLLFVWLILFALLTGWAGDLVVICRALIG
jgi:cytochrome c oxidase subunit 3